MYYQGGRPDKYKVYPLIEGLDQEQETFYYYALGDDNQLFAIDPNFNSILIPGQNPDQVYARIQSANLTLDPWNWEIIKVSGQVSYTDNEFCRFGRYLGDYGSSYEEGSYILKETTGWEIEIPIEIRSITDYWNGEKGNTFSYLCFLEKAENSISRDEIERIYNFYKNIIEKNGEKYYKKDNIGG